MLWVLDSKEIVFQEHYSKKNYTQAIKKDLKNFEARPKGIPSFLKSNLHIPLFRALFNTDTSIRLFASHETYPRFDYF